MRVGVDIGLSCILLSFFKRGMTVAQTRHDSVSREKGPQLWGQVNKCMWWMPWRLQAMKDVAACEKLRGAGKRALIRRYPNGETRPLLNRLSCARVRVHKSPFRPNEAGGGALRARGDACTKAPSG